MEAVPRAYTPHDYSTDLDISSAAFWRQPFNERDKTFAKLRERGEITFHPPMELPVPTTELGFWAVTKADDLAEAARRNDVFLSGYGIQIDGYPWDGSSTSFFHTQDGELHQRNRALVSAAFTPKRVLSLVDDITAEATRVVDDVADGGDFDFVTDVAEKLPARVGARLIDLPESEFEGFVRASGVLIGKADPEFGDPADPMKAFRAARAYVMELGRSMAEQRRRSPGTDLISTLVQAEIDGQRLSDDDIGAFTYLITIASNDTTKQTTTLAQIALADHPDQEAWLREDIDVRLRTAVPEFLRYGNPVIHHARTAAVDIEWRGRQIAKGDRLALFYCSANRDEERFPNAGTFDLSRDPNPQVSFGGGGVHFCLGNRFATTMLTAIYSQLLHRVRVEVTGEPEPLASDLINGVRHLPVHVTAL
ncbi:cytochrome P450 [Microbacterium sp. B19]|uniref:cytochrome P450 n=1 Tax=Microbacterium sp. B19 TaxID=96765 RepID=UPI0004756981|nr:cytochrome P450 [Microbacterium sp. B19]